jgi:DNA polymerase III subunit gamma/tau
VVSVQDGILTLRFAKEGDLKRFSTSDYDADLKRVLSTRFGLKVMVRGEVGGGSGTPAAGVTPTSPGAGHPAEDIARGPVPTVADPNAGLPDEPPDDEEPDDMPPDEPSDDGAASAPAELTGMDLIQRELGGQVISEIED